MTDVNDFLFPKFSAIVHGTFSGIRKECIGLMEIFEPDDYKGSSNQTAEDSRFFEGNNVLYGNKIIKVLYISVLIIYIKF